MKNSSSSGRVGKDSVCKWREMIASAKMRWVNRWIRVNYYKSSLDLVRLLTNQKRVSSWFLLSIQLHKRERRKRKKRRKIYNIIWVNWDQSILIQKREEKLGADSDSSETARREREKKLLLISLLIYVVVWAYTWRAASDIECLRSWSHNAEKWEMFSWPVSFVCFQSSSALRSSTHASRATLRIHSIFILTMTFGRETN